MASQSPGKTSAKPGKANLVRRKRNAEVVRTFLSELQDKGDVKGRTIEWFASEYEVASSSLRKFRDGADSALGASLINSLASVLGSGAAMYGFNFDPEYDLSLPGGLGSQSLYMRDESGRRERIRHYEMIDETRPEASSALDAWADLGITGGVGEAPRRVPFTPDYRGSDKRTGQIIKSLSTLINGRLFPNDIKLQAFRGMCKYGDQWAEIGLEKIAGRYAMTSLQPRHVRTMFVNRNAEGEVDSENPFIQNRSGAFGTTGAGLLTSDKDVLFPAWKIMRCSNFVEWGSVYGSSIFRPCLRSYIQLEAMETGMIIRRLTRAALRYKHVLDVGHLDADSAWAKVDERKAKLRKRRIVETDGKRGMMAISMPPEEDFFIGKKDKDSPTDVSVLDGDANIGEIADVTEIFLPKWFAGLGPPKAHLGWEGDTMRSTITDLHIVFARKVRRMQMKFMAGLNHLYWVGLLLNGIDPRDVDYLILPPMMGTRDELVRAQITQAYATTVQYLASAFGTTGKMPSIEWFLKYVMGTDQEAMDNLELSPVIQPKGKNRKNDPASGLASTELAVQILADDKVADAVSGARALIEERAMSMGKEGKLEGTAHPYAQLNFAPMMGDGMIRQILQR